MDRERAESHLRLLAEAELRRVTALPADSAVGQWHALRLTVAGQALFAVGAVEAGTAKQIQAGVDLAIAGRLRSLLDVTTLGPGGLSPAVRERLEKLVQFKPVQAKPARASAAAFLVSGPSAGRTASQQTAWRIVPAGQVIPRDPGGGGELLLLAYAQTPNRGRFTAAKGMPGSPGIRGPELGPPSRQFTASDDQGTSYQLRLRGGTGVAVLELRPGPPQQIRWLDLTWASGQPAIRIDLGPQDPPVPAPDVTVTPQANSPGELLLDIIAAHMLTAAAGYPQQTPEQLAAASPKLLTHNVAGRLGDIVAALQAADTLSPASPVPGQLAGLCARLGISGHGITAPPAGNPPERWESMLTRYHRRMPYRAPAPGSSAAAAAELPELDGARVAILGLHHDGHSGTIMHMLASGVTPERQWGPYWPYSRPVQPLPVLWIRDSSDHWHTTQPHGGFAGGSGEAVLWVRIVPPLDRDTDWIEVAAAGRSAEARARLPLRWR